MLLRITTGTEEATTGPCATISTSSLEPLRYQIKCITEHVAFACSCSATGVCAMADEPRINAKVTIAKIISMDRCIISLPGAVVA